MEVGLSILLQPAVNFAANNLEFVFFCLYLPLNFKSYSIMFSNPISEDVQKSSVSDSCLVVSVLISNYPLSNGGYLVSFGQDGPDGSFKNYDPALSLDYQDSNLGRFLDCSSVFLPKGCYYLPQLALGDFICALSSGASFFEMNLLPASGSMQGLLLVKVNEDSFFDHEPKEED